MRGWRGQVVLLAVAAWVFTSGTNAESRFHVREWHRETGLPTEAVNDTVQDRHGYLWLATTAGLVRFDGREFVLQSVPESIQPAGQALLAVFPEPDGLWVVPRSGNTMRYRDGRFTADPLPAAFANTSIAAAFLAADGGEWLAFRGGAVLRRHQRTVQTFSVAQPGDREQVTRFATDARQRVWISHGAFLGRYQNGALAPVDLGTGDAELRVASSRTEGPWIITPDRVLKLDAQDTPHVHALLPSLLGAHYVSAACEDSSGALWIGTRSQGVHRITPAAIEHVATSHESINSLREDADGTLWVGTNAGGLNAIGPKLHQLYDRTRGLPQNATYAIAEDADGTIWAANGDGAIVRIRGEEVVVLSQQVEWPRLSVVAVGAKPGGGIWFGGPAGLFELDAEWTRPPRLLAALAPSGIRRMFTDREGNLWTSVDPGRVARWSRDGSHRFFDETNGFAGGDARCFALDEAGVLWVGTSQGRVLRLVNDHFVPVPLPTRLRPSAINAIHFAANDTILLATAQEGIAHLSGGTLALVDRRHGLPDNNVTQFVPDAEGYLWCGSATGIFRLDPREVGMVARGESAALNPVILGRDEGLKTIVCSALNFPAAIRTHDGRLWFATRQGALAIDPSTPLLRARPRLARIERLSVDGRALPLRNPITVPAVGRKLQIRFSVLCLAAPHRVEIEHRLDGFDSEWTRADVSNVANYPRLRPGTYTFHLRAGVHGQSEHPVTDAITFVVPTPWWQAEWLIGLAGLLVLTVVSLGVRKWSTRRLRRRLANLERERAVERERARIAQNIHDDVGASLTHISLLTQAALTDRSPDKLNRIYETTRDLTRSLDEIVWAVNPQHDTLDSFAEYLSSYAQRFLTVADIRCRLDFPEQLPGRPLGSQQRHHLFLCCREALNNVVKHSRATEVTLQLHVDSNHLTITIADNGIGLPPEDPDSQPHGRRARLGNGLPNLRQRMHELGGTSVIAPSGTRRGTSVRLRIPLNS